MKDIVGFLHGNAPQQFCFLCLAYATRLGTAEDVRAAVRTAMDAHEYISISQGVCQVCSERTIVAASTREC
jgi:hypothetical protein